MVVSDKLFDDCVRLHSLAFLCGGMKTKKVRNAYASVRSFNPSIAKIFFSRKLLRLIDRMDEFLILHHFIV